MLPSYAKPTGALALNLRLFGLRLFLLLLQCLLLLLTGKRLRLFLLKPGLHACGLINPKVEGGFVLSSQVYSTAVMGIYSTKPGARGRRQKTDLSYMKDEVPMAMIGIVPTKVSAENGPIHPGDLLVTSSRPGYAMKGTDRSQMLGAVIGKALGHLDVGTGVIEIGVTLQ